MFLPFYSENLCQSGLVHFRVNYPAYNGVSGFFVCVGKQQLQQYCILFPTESACICRGFIKKTSESYSGGF